MEQITRTLGEIAELLKVSQLTVRRLWIRGKFPAPIQIGRVIRWRESDVKQWLEEQPVSTRYSEKVES